MKIDRLDQQVLTVKGISITGDFYSRVPCMNKVSFADNRKTLVFGETENQAA